MKKQQEAITTMKILSNRNRLAIVSLLLSNKKDLCVNEIAEQVGISQSATSHQLAYLEAWGVVESTRTAQTKCYVLNGSSFTKKIARVARAALQ